MVRTRLKIAATLAVVVLALTGFQTGHGGHGSGKSGSGKSRGHSSGSDDDSGGGCSSDEKRNDDYEGANGPTQESTYEATPSASPTSGASARVVDCVKPAQKKRKGKPARKADTTATVTITSDDWTEKTFRVEVYFEGADGKTVDRAETTVTTGRTKTFEVAMAHPGSVGRVKKCWAGVLGEVTGGTPSGTPTATASGSPSPAP